jgi:Uma2 family endonuclease
MSDEVRGQNAESRKSKRKDKGMRVNRAENVVAPSQALPVVTTDTANRAQPVVEQFPILVRLEPLIHLTDEQFYEVCQLNHDLRLERTARGELVILPPTGGETSERNAEVTMQLRLWAKRDGTGSTFDSSGGFVLPNGAIRSPDAAWVNRLRLELLTTEQRKRFLPLCPDFVIELRSPTDSVTAVQTKMEEYLANGAQLGFLLDPEYKRVYVYRPAVPVECIENPETISAEPLLPGFTLDLREVWSFGPE